MITSGGLKQGEVVIAVSEEEVLLSMFGNYILTHNIPIGEEGLRIGIAGFTNYVCNWLRDHYGCDD